MVVMNRKIRHSCSQKDPFDNSSLLNKFALIPVLLEFAFSLFSHIFMEC